MVQRRKPKRSKTLSFLMFPLFIFIFAAGWLISWVDSQSSSLETEEKQKKDQFDEHVTIGIIPLETEIRA